MENQTNNTNPQQPQPQQQIPQPQPQVQPQPQFAPQPEPVQSMPTQQNIPPVATPEPVQNVVSPVSPSPVFQNQLNTPPQPVQTNVQPAQMFGAPAPIPAGMPGGAATPSLGNAYLDKPRPGITLGILSLVFALLMPIVGFVLAIISIIKGFKKPNSNKALGIMGIIAIPVGIVSGFIWMLAAANLMTVSYSSLKTYSGSFGSIGYSFDYPEEMVEDTSVDVPGVVFLKDPTDQDDGANNSVAIFIAENMGSLNLTPDIIEEVYRGPQGKIVMEDALKRSVSDIDEGTNLTIGEYTSASSGGMEGFYMDVSYNSPKTDLLIKGKIAFFVDTEKNHGYNLIMLAPEKVWDNNTKTWDKMQASIESTN